MQEGLVKSLGVFTGFILGLLLICLMFGGCRSVRTEYIPVESTVYRTDTVHHTQRLIERDTVTILERIIEQRTDSVAPILDSLGRMIGYDHWRIIDRSASLSVENIRLRSQIDSLKAVGFRTEIKREPYPVEVPVETNVLRWWQKALMCAGAIFILGIEVAVWWLVRRKK